MRSRRQRRRSRADEHKRATRVWSQMVLERLIPVLPELIGGSADLTGSNGTRTKHAHAGHRQGQLRRQLHPLRRARACHGGGDERHRALTAAFIPVRRHVPRLHRLLPAGDPPVRADAPARDLRDDARLDRARRGRSDASAGRASGGAAGDPEPARVPACGRRRDGRVLGAGAAAHAERRRSWPCRGRRCRTLRTTASAENLCAKGAYVLREPDGKRDVTLLATGSESASPWRPRMRSPRRACAAAVVSMPSMELFRAQPEAYRDAGARRGARASPSRPASSSAGTNGSAQGGGFVGMSDFGASAPAPKLFEHFGITAEQDG